MTDTSYSQMAEQVRSRGRGPDTMLVHMTPDEVGGLQSLALASGGSLTVNPDTGLPEAGWLGRLLPTLLGVAGAAFGLPTWAIGLGGLAGGTAATGDLGKGVLAGLGAIGGAGIGGALGLNGAISGNALGLLGGQGAAGAASAAGAAGAAVPGAVPGAAAAVPGAAAAVPGAAVPGAAAAAGLPPLPPGFDPGSLLNTNLVQAGQIPGAQVANPGLLESFRNTTSLGLGGLPGTALSAASGYAALSPLLTPDYGSLPTEEEEEGVAPRYGPRNLQPRLDPRFPNGEINFFDNNPAVRLAEGDMVPASGGGLGDYINMFRTSPGAIQAPLGYGANSPSAQIRQSLQATTPQPTGPAAGVIPPSGAPIFNIPRGRPTLPNLGAGGGGDAFDLQSILDRLGRGDNGTNTLNLRAFASGGEVRMESGGFVMPARETAEFGNGDTVAGQQKLMSLGGIPIRGHGDGVSDSIPATIDGKHPARLATGETYFPPEAVKRLGGAERLRAMMNAATKSRQRAERGGEHKIKGLA